MVYESGGNVWYEYSVDGGLHWNVYQVGIDGAKNPVLAHEGNYGIVVYQQESKLRMAIFDYQFSSGTWSVSRWDSGDIDDFGTTYLIYPAVTAHNSKLLISYRKSDGLYYAFGNFFTGTYYEYRKGFISGTSANCRYSSIEVDKSSANFKVHLVYEYAPSVNYTKVFWKTLENTSGITILQSAPEEVSIGSGYSWNEKPVIAVMDNGTPRVVWQGGIDAIEKVSFGFQQQSRTYRTCLRARDGNGNNWYPTIWKFGSDTKYGSIQRSSDNNYIIGWLEGTNVKYARNNDYYVRDSGMDGYGLPIASGASTRNDITFSSVSDGNEPRWFVYTEGLGKENTITPFYGREGAVTINNIDYYFVLADIFHNNTAIDFVELKEDDFISNFTQLNAKLESEPFEISSGDELYFSILYGLTAFEEEDVDLSETDFIDFKVELVDVGNNSILGTFDHISYTSDNYALYKDIAYSVNTDGIGDKTVKLRLVVNSSETGKFALSSINSDSQILYKPSSPQEIYFSGDPNIVEEYSLLNCYPNPFNPATNIEFNVKEAGFVDLIIYNILGEEITKLVNKKMAPGKHTVVFNAEHLPSGVYIYKLSVNEFVESKKMILTK
ncbi:MAG: T9SS type A sorting domain-containing protein [Melioribacteraceae bacterium]|nr:T9SS type A sorting domain-containing protein [Melioribacteraceae bacterium]